MNINDNACLLNKRGALGFIASKLAPTGIKIMHMNNIDSVSIEFFALALLASYSASAYLLSIAGHIRSCLAVIA